MDQHQYAYRENRPTEEAFTPALLTALTHLGKKGAYARLHFINYSSAFNTIIPNQLLTKPLHLAVNNNLCKWIRHFLKDRPETASLGPHQPSSLSLSAGAPQGCVLSPPLYSIYTYDCTPLTPQTVITFAQLWWGKSLITRRMPTQMKSAA